MSKAGKRLIEAAKQAAEIAKGDREPASIYVPADVDVKKIRHSLDLSQDDFASEFGFSVNQIRNWEQGRTRPLGGERAYLMMIECSPETVRKLLEQLRKQHKERDAA